MDRRTLGLAAVAMLLAAAAPQNPSTHDDGGAACESTNWDARIDGCTALIRSGR